MKAPDTPLVGKVGGAVIDGEDDVTIVNTCDSTEEREHMIIRKTDMCILGDISSFENLRGESQKRYRTLDYKMQHATAPHLYLSTCEILQR